MATLKLKSKPPPPDDPRAEPEAFAARRAPVRGAGAGVQKRQTLAEKQAQQAEREAREARRHAPPAQTATPAAPATPAARPPAHDRAAGERSPRERPPREASAREPSRRETPPRGPLPRDPQQRGPQPRNTQPRSTPERGAQPRRPPPADTAPAPRRAAPYGPAPGRDTRGSAPPSPPRPTRQDGGARAKPPSRAFAEPPSRAFSPPAGRARAPAPDDTAHAPGSLRLSKRMSELGLASRREADEWIAKGWVRVDGQVAAELGTRVLPDQRVTIDAQARHQQAQRVTVLINKPMGYVSGQAEDGYEPAFVLVTPANQWRDDHSGTRFLREHLRSLVPAGRLDIDSVGLLVLTQDGRVAKQLIGEDSLIEKEYLVRVQMGDEMGNRPGDEPGATPADASTSPHAPGSTAARLPAASLARLRHGLELDGEALRPAVVEWVNDDQLRFVLTQGKKRQIRRMCEAVGLHVAGLKRVRIGKLVLGDLPTGQWRYLRAGEQFV